MGFGDSSLDFRVLFWTHFDNGLGTKSRVGVAIDEAFKKEGIEIPFPQRDLHVRSVSEKVMLVSCLRYAALFVSIFLLSACSVEKDVFTQTQETSHAAENTDTRLGCLTPGQHGLVGYHPPRGQQ